MSKNQGDMAEVAFTLECLKRGYSISEPVGDNQKYDRIVDVKGRLLKIQIKSCSRTLKSRTKNPCWRFTTGHGQKSKSRYLLSDVDVFALYIIEKDLWVIIPNDNLGNRVGLCIFESKVNMWSKYIDNWEPFCI